MDKKEKDRRIEALKTSPAYMRAYKDLTFLRRDELRPVRLQLELRKPELLMKEQGVDSTVVVFGSTRIPSTEEGEWLLSQEEERLKRRPDDDRVKRRVAVVKRLSAKSRFYEEARRFAGIVSSTCQRGGKCDYVIVTGGGPGIMEAANRGADEVGGKSIGLNITLPMEQEPNPYITPQLCFQFHYFAVRKMHFMMRARALVVFPGGFGTFDELFETLTLVQTRTMDPVPIILFGKESWSTAINFQFLVDEGVISPSDLDLISYVETAEEAWNQISHFYNLGETRTIKKLEE